MTAPLLADSVSALRLTFANPRLRRVQLALVGSDTGYWMYSVALAVYAFGEGGAGAVALIYALRMAASAAAAPFAALLADRFPRQRVMVASDLIRFVALVAAAVAVIVDAPLWSVTALAVVVAVVGTAFYPAQASLLPSLAATPAELASANAVTSLIESTAIFLGPAVGGVLVAATDPQTVLAATALTVLWSAALLARIPRDERPAEPAGGAAARTFAGFAAIARTPQLRLLIGLVAAHTLVIGATNVLIVVLALDVLDLGEPGVGLLLAAIGVGGVLGGVLAAGPVARRPALVYVWTTLLAGAATVLLGAAPVVVVAVLAAAVAGAATAASDIADTTLLQRGVPDDVLGRVFGVMMSVVFAMIALGAALAPALVDLAGARGAFVVLGIALAAVGLVTWRPVLAIDQAAVPHRRIALLRAIPMFAPLPLPTVEELARRLKPVSVAAGTAVFHQGDAGDHFYLVQDGVVNVQVDGGPASTLDSGSYFGEIALLRDTPRTATVSATRDAELLTLERDDFISAVTGHPASADAADAVIAGRLGVAGQAYARG